MAVRFRAYKLENAGSSFSFFDGERFTLVEARLNKSNEDSIRNEMDICCKKQIDTLHITSWDIDHCNHSELSLILKLYKPLRIEEPKYQHKTKNAFLSKKIVDEYRKNIIVKALKRKTIKLTTKQIAKLGYPPKGQIRFSFQEEKKSNNNSSVGIFRIEGFSVVSLGDMEHVKVSNCVALCAEPADIFIVPHHGSKTSCVTEELVKKINPKYAICCVNENNRYGHPHQDIIDIFRNLKIAFHTTQKKDVIISKDQSGKFQLLKA